MIVLIFLGRWKEREGGKERWVEGGRGREGNREKGDGGRERKGERERGVQSTIKAYIHVLQRNKPSYSYETNKKVERRKRERETESIMSVNSQVTLLKPFGVAGIFDGGGLVLFLAQLYCHKHVIITCKNKRPSIPGSISL